MIRSYTQNRELSWLRFNERVLQEAADETVPLLERLKFISIFTSNLDEFFMIRVGSLYDLAAMKKDAADGKTGMTAQQQLDAIYDETRRLTRLKDETYLKLESLLREKGICDLAIEELGKEDAKFVKQYFKAEIEPILSPQIVDGHHPFPHLANKMMHIGAALQDKYGKIIAATGTQLGQIYDVTCNKSGKATEIHGSSDAWEKNSLTGVEFDESARRVKQAGSSYVYASYAAVLSNANKINIAQIVAQDEVTLRGVGDTVYSITVDKGHGYITFQGVDAFIGGYASIGTKQLFEVTSGMLTTTQEGTYTVELQKGSLTGTKTVTVARDASVTVDFSEFTTKATQRGAVNFSITPVNAVMTIDGVETDYSQPVSLTYGKHRVVLSANGYEQYVETVAVSQAYQTVVIDMTASSATTTAAGSTKTAATAANKATTAADLDSATHTSFYVNGQNPFANDEEVETVFTSDLCHAHSINPMEVRRLRYPRADIRRSAIRLPLPMQQGT